MAHVQYKEIALRGKAMKMVEQANAIFADPENAGQVMTLRQLYYQFIGRDLFANTKLNYRKLARVMSDARIAGLIDWDLIEDRGRMPVEWATQESPDAAVAAALRDFNLDHHVGQKNHVELWVEKDALSGVLRPIASEFQVVLSVNKGFSSSSAVRMAADRMIGIAEAYDRPTTVLYVGDFDPSGEDMTRDLTSRLEMFGVQDLTFKKIALTTAQIKQYKLPTNPVKASSRADGKFDGQKGSDPRGRDYVRKHGRYSWEVDALKNSVLLKTIRDELNGLLDMKKFEAITATQETLRADAIRRVGEKREQVTIEIPDICKTTVEANEADAVKLREFATTAQGRIEFGDEEHRTLTFKHDELIEAAAKVSVERDELIKAFEIERLESAHKEDVITKLEAKIKTLTAKKKGTR